MKPKQSEAFETWLREQEYAESTIALTVRGVARLTRDLDRAPVNGNTRDFARRALLYGKGWSRAERDTFARIADAPPPTRLQKKRRSQARKKRKKPALSDAEYALLVEQLQAGAEDGDAAAAVLYVMAVWGLRVGDVLRITRERLSTGLRNGTLRLVQKGGGERRIPADAAWGLLYDAIREHPTVALGVAPGGDGSPIAGDAAYKAVRGRLQAYGEQLELDGLHTHRLRRTAAVQTLRATGSVDATRQLLGHASLQSTMTYVDELRHEELTDIQKRRLGMLKGDE